MSVRATAEPVWWPPPVPAPRHRWLGWVVIGLCTTLLAGALYAADRVGRPEVSAAVARFLPADGASWYSTEETRRGGQQTSVATVTESAVIVGSAVTSAVSWTLATQVIGAVNGDADVLTRSQYWRTTTTALTGQAPQTTRVYRVGREVALLVESGADGGYVYQPNLVELPADVAPGRSWQSSGSAGAALTYRASFAAAAAPDGCLRVAGTISYSGGPRRSRELQKTWCPEAGLVVEDWQGGGEQRRVARSAAPAEAAVPRTTAAIVNWRPTSWQEQRYASATVDPTFGPGPVSGTPSSVPPARTAADVLLRPTTSGQDILGFGPPSGGSRVARWRVHPGGVILTLTAFGDVFVATTSDRTVVGYDTRGVRLWQFALAEVVTVDPVRASDREFVLVTTGGEVVLADLATGEQRWARQPGSDIGVRPAVAAGLVLVADRSDSLVALDQGTGRERWRIDTPAASSIAAAGEQLVLVGPSFLDAFDVADGRRRWRADYFGAATGLASFGPWTLFLGGDGVRALDGQGRTAWSRPGVRGLTVHRDYLVCWGRRQAEVLDAAGAVVQRFPTPEESVGSTHRYLAGERGVSLLDSTWDFRSWDHG